ncbi:MAG: hypothetical protein CO189_01515 [candidate division Zixibacteria bacterium CG_4_9_14_3_um_filter_46_8]|nr:MAG: hypothetical protein CO189_01515 [candidate division Zixibacteria bacterium CG_4_9_14_3_um_filter_46_8]
MLYEGMFMSKAIGRFPSALLILLTFIFFLVSISHAQYYFGQNKVQYTHFDWKVLPSEHFDVYFYPEEQSVAEVAANNAEEAYRELCSLFSMVIDKKIPLIIYSSPAYFSETNVIPGLLPENVGGFTEFMKERVVLPFNGSYTAFQRVIKHELVHVFTFRKLVDLSSMGGRSKIASPPLWFTEGIAEYYSERSDAPEVDMIVGDIYLSGKPISLYDMYYLGVSYAVYKLGQAFCQFVAESYGAEKLLLLFDNWPKSDSFEEILSKTLGESFDKINDKWIYSQKKKYYPKLSDGEIPGFIAERLTDRGFNVKPAVYKNPKGQTWVIFKANRVGYSGIYGFELGRREVRNLIKGERSADYESLHLLESSISVSKDGLLAFVSKKNERDRINIYDLKNGSNMRALDFDSLVRISSPDWSPDGKRLVFSGVAKDGHTDLYICNVNTEDLTRITRDLYFDSSPRFSPQGKYVAFTSDRGEYSRNGSSGIYLYELDSRQLYSLVDDDARYYTPSWSASDDTLIFTCDRGGANNIYLLSGINTGELSMRQLSHIPTGASDPIFADSSIIFSAYSEGAFHLYELKLKDFARDSAIAIDDDSKPFHSSWEPPKLRGDLKKGIAQYQTKYSFDIAQSAVAYDAVFGPVGGLQFALTDVLGNHQYYFILSNTANSTRDFAKSFNAAVTYLNRSSRINWGLGAYRFRYDLYNDYDGQYIEQQIGVVGVMVYPFGRFRRLELSMYLRHFEKEFAYFDSDLNGVLLTPNLSYIKDTSLWERTGPLDGMRLNLTVGSSFNLQTGEQFGRLFLGDFRKYFRLSMASCLATRLLYITSAGKDPQRYYLGGSWTLRGYGFRTFYGRNVLLTSTELRFPLIDALFIGFPVGNFDFKAIRGALFLDAGDAWNNDFDQLYGSFGVGARVNLGAFVVLRFDLAHRTDFKSVSKRTNFDFFFGWNF